MFMRNARPPGAARRPLIVAAAATTATLMFGAAPADAQDDQEFTGTFAAVNESGASGDMSITLSGTTAEVTINMSGLADDVHAQHIHGEVGAENVCPEPALDEDGDGLISTVEGVPAYGLVKVSLTTEGDSSPDSALAIDRFPTGSSYTYTQTIELPEDIAGDLGNMNVIIHGLDIDGSGAYDGDAVSSLDPGLPLEATIPVACGKIVAAAAAPTGGVATGAGGTSSTPAPLVALVAAVGAAAVLTTTRRHQRV
ncbi:MAG: hypothetical protein R2733_00425 [Acidimicrobiales bacterium]